MNRTILFVLGLLLLSLGSRATTRATHALAQGQDNAALQSSASNRSLKNTI